MSDDIEKILTAKLKKAIATLPKVLANEAVNYSLDAFKNQGWDGKSWQGRKRGNSNRAILVASGRMRRETKAENITDKGFKLVNDVPYAKANNEGFSGTVKVGAYSRNKYSKSKQQYTTKGGKKRNKTVRSISVAIQVKAHSRKMNLPQRQFAGKSESLIKRLVEKGKSHLLKALNS